jgi:hypothetical protein
MKVHPDRGMLCSPKKARNIELLEDWIAGMPYAELTAKYNVHRSRISQIIAKAWQMEHLPRRLRERVIVERVRRRRLRKNAPAKPGRGLGGVAQ